MAKRTARDFAATMEQQMKQFKPVRVNPFPLMMDAARHNQAQQPAMQPSQGPAAAGNHSSTTTATAAAQQAAMACTLCSHCGTGLSELQVQQCHSCKSVYCSSCSVINYDEREDRIFCLDCNTEGMQLTSCEDTDFAYGAENSAYGMYHQHYHQQQHQYNQFHQQQQHQQQQYMCSPPGRDMVGGCQGAAALSAERRSSVMRACNMAAAAAAAAADSGGSCMAAMAGISGLGKEQMTPLFAQGGLCGFGGSSTGRAQRGGVLGQWDLNSPPLARIALGQGALATSAVLPFTAGY